MHPSDQINISYRPRKSWVLATTCCELLHLSDVEHLEKRKKRHFIHIYRLQKEIAIFHQSILAIAVYCSKKNPPAAEGKEVGQVLFCLEKHPR